MIDLVIFGGAIALAIVFQSAWPLSAFVVYSLGKLVVVRGDLVRAQAQLYRAIRLRHVGIAVGTLVMVIGLAYGLFLLPESWGNVVWWSWVAATGSPGGNIVFLPLQDWWIAMVFVPLLLIVLPLLANLEERVFRAGTRGWLDAIWRSLIFGAVHALVGVPLGVAVLGLGLAGGVFALVYLRTSRRAREEMHNTLQAAPGDGLAGALPGAPVEELVAREAVRRGVRESTLVHLTYNLIGFAVLLVILAWPA